VRFRPTPAPWRSAYRGGRMRHTPSPLHAQKARRRRVTIVPGKTGAPEQHVHSVGADRWGSMPNGAQVSHGRGLARGESGPTSALWRSACSGRAVGTQRPPRFISRKNATARDPQAVAFCTRCRPPHRPAHGQTGDVHESWPATPSWSAHACAMPTSARRNQPAREVSAGTQWTRSLDLGSAPSDRSGRPDRLTGATERW
jgi:hypothetical protein